MTEADMARRECKASSVLSKWKETENRALNGGGPEDDAAGESERKKDEMYMSFIFGQDKNKFLTCPAVTPLNSMNRVGWPLVAH